MTVQVIGHFLASRQIVCLWHEGLMIGVQCQLMICSQSKDALRVCNAKLENLSGDGNRAHFCDFDILTQTYNLNHLSPSHGYFFYQCNRSLSSRCCKQILTNIE